MTKIVEVYDVPSEWNEEDTNTIVSKAVWRAVNYLIMNHYLYYDSDRLIAGCSIVVSTIPDSLP
jgi:hypothetical protein